MLDNLDGKRGMVKQLLDMLKSHASNEVSSGMKAPEGMPEDAHGIEVSKVEVLPGHEMDEPTPEHDVIESPMEKMADGGYADVAEKAAPMGAEDGHPEIEGAAHAEADESDAEREDEGDIDPPSMFASFLGKKRKK